MNQSSNSRPRFRDHGFRTGLLAPASRNTIADVAGVRVGHGTKVDGTSIRTGVTIIDPGVPNLFRQKLPAAIAVGNGFGKLVGSTQVQELGTLETPIALTNTLAVGRVMRGVVDLVIRETPDLKPTETINAIVGETNDGFLNDIRANTVIEEDVAAAYAARSDRIDIGCVGAGTGTRAFSWKGGIGTASRAVPVGKQQWTLGVFVQTNFGGALTMLGVPVGNILGKTDFDSFAKTGDGSCMIVVATDAPLSARQLGRIARRAFLGLARTGSVLAQGSGDYAIAFSTSRVGIEGSEESGQCLRDEDLTPFFLAAVEATEESVYDTLWTATTVSGRDGNTFEALPIENVVPLLERAQRGQS